MKIRRLETKDAVSMLEWMHDDNVVQYLSTDFSKKTLNDCLEFIENAENGGNIHKAIVDDNDCYLGTVSLKNIDIISNKAEFAITIRRCAMGLGYAKEAMNFMIQFGFEMLNLNRIYWCVSPHNIRAIKFYDKNGYHRIPLFENAVGYDKKFADSLIWYEIESN